MNHLRTKYFFILCLFLFSQSFCFSQNSDSTKTMKTGIFVSGGVNSRVFYNSNFFTFLFNQINSSAPAISSGYDNPETISAGSTIPSHYTYTSMFMEPTINTGIALTSIKNKKIRHIFEISFSRFSGQYSYNDSYQERSNPPYAPAGAWINIRDTVKAPYIQNVFSLGYKLQFNYKIFFCSIGINCNLNFVNINEQKKEEQDYWTIPEFPGYDTTHNGPYDSIKNINKNVFFINIPMQIGIGARINFRRLYIEPAFYFTPCLMEGYNIYNASIRFIYSLK